VLFDVERTTLAGRPCLTVRGELDLSTAPQLDAAVEELLSGGPRAFVVDLTPTTFLDSSGARALLRVTKQAAAAGAALHVLAPRSNGPVRLVVDMLHLEASVPLVGSPAQIPVLGFDAGT
jgi:anti-anti-sigma factor